MGGPDPTRPPGAMSGGAVALFVRRELRRRLASYLVLALVLALGIGVSIGSLVLAHRTDHAYGDYVARAHVNQLVINPSLASEDMEAAIRSFEGVRSVHTNDLILAVFDHLDGGILQELATEERTANLQVLGSPDGRYTEVDQPTVVRGRLPTGDHEIFVSADYLDRVRGAPRPADRRRFGDRHRVHRSVATEDRRSTRPTRSIRTSSCDRWPSNSSGCPGSATSATRCSPTTSTPGNGSS